MPYRAFRGPAGSLTPLVGRLGGTTQITASHPVPTSGVSFWAMPGTAPNYLSTPTTTNELVPTVSLRWEAYLSVTSAAADGLLGDTFLAWRSAPNYRSFHIRRNVTAAGGLRYLAWNNSGTLASLDLSPVPAWTSNIPLWLAMTHTLATGIVEVFYSTQPGTTPWGEIAWTSAGTTAGAGTSIRAGSGLVDLGSADSATVPGPWKGRHYKQRLLVDGAVKVQSDAADITGNAVTSYTDPVTARTWSIVRGATPIVWNVS